MAELETIGFGPCIQAVSETEICMARVLYKVNKGGRPYHNCTGGFDLNSKACGSRIQQHGPRAEKLIRQLVMQEKEKDDVQHEEGGQPTVAQGEPASTGDGEPVTKQRGGFFSLE